MDHAHMTVAARWRLCLVLMSVACVSRDDGASGSDSTGTDGWLPRPDTPAPEADDPGYDDALAEQCEAVQLDGENRTQLGSGLFVDCDPDGEPTDPVTLLHRVEAVACYYGIPHTWDCRYTNEDCARDQDCTEGKYGRCMEAWSRCECLYDCVTDADCAPDEACLCGSKLVGMDEPQVLQTQCYSAHCRGDDDCPGDFRCLVSGHVCFTTWGLRCQTPDDECATTADCLAVGNEMCIYSDQEDRWICTDHADCD
jgi:hypothetical protein